MTGDDVRIISDLAKAAVEEARAAVQRKMALAFTPEMSAKVGMVAYAMLEAQGRIIRQLAPSPASNQLVDELEKEALSKSMDRFLDLLAKHTAQANP